MEIIMEMKIEIKLVFIWYYTDVTELQISPLRELCAE